jgi:hypothetical protein
LPQTPEDLIDNSVSVLFRERSRPKQHLVIDCAEDLLEEQLGVGIADNLSIGLTALNVEQRRCAPRTNMSFVACSRSRLGVRQ